MARQKKSKDLAAEDVIRKFTTSETYFKQLHGEMEYDNRIFELNLPVKAPNGFNVIYPDTGRTIVMTAADHIAGDSPKVQVPQMGLTKKSQDRSERLEKGLQASLYRIQSDGTENPIRTLVINGLWSGMMVAQGPLFDADEWGLVPVGSDYEGSDAYKDALDEYETNKRINWPFLWRAIDPRYFFPDPGTMGKEWVIIHYERTAGSIKEQWPEWSGKLKGSNVPVPDDTLLEWYEYWDESRRIYMIGSDILDQRPHRYHRPPFQVKSAGYGNEASAFPHERFRSILWPARSLLLAEIGAWSHRDALIRRTAWTQVLAAKGSGFDSIEPGTVKEIDERFLTDPNLIRSFSEINPVAIQAVDGEIASLSQQIQKATFPDVVQGIRAKGIASGYGQNSLVAQARVKYGAIVVNLTSLIQEMLVALAGCVENVVEEPVPVWGKTKWGMLDATLTPDDVSGLRYVVVDINPKLPADRANEIELGGVLLDRGVIDTDFYLQEYVGVEEPGQMRIRVLRDRALNDPSIQRVLALHAALKGGYIDYVMEAAKDIGMDPTQLLSVLGFGNPSQQAPAANQGAGNPQNVAAQRQGGQATLFGGNQNAQPVPGSPAASPGVTGV